MPSGKVSITFCDKWRSVKLINPPISCGRSSRRFSDMSRHANFCNLPISYKSYEEKCK